MSRGLQFVPAERERELNECEVKTDALTSLDGMISKNKRIMKRNIA